MKDRLADEPEEVIHARPKLTELDESFSTVLEKIQRIDTVFETKKCPDGLIDEGASAVIQSACYSQMRTARGS